MRPEHFEWYFQNCSCWKSLVLNKIKTKNGHASLPKIRVRNTIRTKNNDDIEAMETSKKHKNFEQIPVPSNINSNAEKFAMTFKLGVSVASKKKMKIEQKPLDYFS